MARGDEYPLWDRPPVAGHRGVPEPKHRCGAL